MFGLTFPQDCTYRIITSVAHPDIEIIWPEEQCSLLHHEKRPFSQFRTKLVSSHLFSILSKWERQDEKESPKTEKSSMKTSIVSSIMSWKWPSCTFGTCPEHYINQKAYALSNVPKGQCEA
ncbi:hypothetical protein Tco_0873593 [Tanacetum coccineum]|uniref:Uncharacterized protein n=1 Tax=Tanacetum coccineum TaxID=301880 RepID=A0ABQ5BM54_9ASTR